MKTFFILVVFVCLWITKIHATALLMPVSINETEYKIELLPNEANGNDDVSYNDKLVASMKNYKLSSRSDRLRDSFVVRQVLDILNQRNSRSNFLRLCITLIDICNNPENNLSLGDLSTLFYDVANSVGGEHNKETIINHLTFGVIYSGGFIQSGNSKFFKISYDFVKLLRGMFIGEMVVVSPEVRGINGWGGLGLYVSDIVSAYSDLGLDVYTLSYLYHYGPDDNEIFEDTIRKGDFKYVKTGNYIPFFGEPDDLSSANNKFDIYFKFYNKKQKALVISNPIYTSKLYGKVYQKNLSGEDYIRIFRFMALSALDTIRMCNINPSIIQTNDGWVGLIPPYINELNYGNDCFENVITLHTMHNLNRAYQAIVCAQDAGYKDHLMRVAGFTPENYFHRRTVSPWADSDIINPTYAALKTSTDGMIVSPGYKKYILSNADQLGDAVYNKYKQNALHGELNGINAIDWQKRVFDGKSFFECSNAEERTTLYYKVASIKSKAKIELQNYVRELQTGMLSSDLLSSIEKYYGKAASIAIISAINNGEIVLNRSDKFKIDRNMLVGMNLHRLTEQKGYDISIDAFEIFLHENPNVQIVVGGMPENSPKGIMYALKLFRLSQIFPDRFFNVGSMDTNSRLYELMYLAEGFFIMPSLFEPAGLSDLEAIALGNPVVVRNVDGLASAVEDLLDGLISKKPYTGIKFNEFTVPSLVEALNKMLSVYQNRKTSKYWFCMQYNCLNYDSRWVRHVKNYISDVFGKRKGVDIYNTVEVPLLLRIFSEDDAHIERLLIEHGFNTENGLDYVWEDAFNKLLVLADDTRPIVRNLAKKLIEKHSAKVTSIKNKRIDFMTRLLVSASAVEPINSLVLSSSL